MYVRLVAVSSLLKLQQIDNLRYSHCVLGLLRGEDLEWWYRHTAAPGSYCTLFQAVR